VSGTREEIEVKARVDDPEALMRALLAAGARVTFEGEMIDRRYDKDGALERKDEVLRLRLYRPAAGGDPWGVLGWKGPQSARSGYRHRAEWETNVADPEAARAIVERLGYAVSWKIDRHVTQLVLDGAVIRVERYPDMDVLVEVEGGPANIERAVAASGLPRGAFLAESLPYFMQSFERRTGRPARVTADTP
jgi:adenylate cyclase class IV